MRQDLHTSTRPSPFSLGRAPLSAISSILISFTLSSGCENVQIFAEPERPQVAETETLESVGACMSDEDCPQWSCVSSTCQEGLCIPARRGAPTIDASALSRESTYVSISLHADQVVGLLGEPDPEARSPRSLGRGEALKRWSRQDGEWTEDDWSPDLVRVSVRPPVTEEDEAEETREPLSLHAVTLEGASEDSTDEPRLWIHAGDELRDVWSGAWGQDPARGVYHRLAAPLQAVMSDGEEAWASVFDKGLERLEINPQTSGGDDDDEEVESFEANARFNTPGRALYARAGRSFIVVADGYAGLSLFSKRVDGALESTTAARRLVTPPQELSTEGRAVHLDLIEDRVLSAELGMGVGVSRITPAGGLERELTFALGGDVRWVSWIDPYTPLIWVEGRGIVILDLLITQDELPVVIAELSLEALGDPALSAEVWSSDADRFALLSERGVIFEGSVSCQ